VRRVRGRLMDDPGTGCPPVPGDLAKVSLRACIGLPGTFSGSPGSPCGARVAAVCVPLRSCGRPPGSDPAGLTLGQPCASRRSQALPHCWRSAGNGRSRAPWISARQHAGLPSRRRSVPRWVLDPNAPSRARTHHCRIRRIRWGLRAVPRPGNAVNTDEVSNPRLRRRAKLSPVIPEADPGEDRGRLSGTSINETNSRGPGSERRSRKRSHRSVRDDGWKVALDGIRPCHLQPVPKGLGAGPPVQRTPQLQSLRAASP